VDVKAASDLVRLALFISSWHISSETGTGGSKVAVKRIGIEMASGYSGNSLMKRSGDANLG
jgi:hypothetical protein